MRTVENVVSLSRGTVYELIYAFLISNRSASTRSEYTRDIREFFRYLRNKDIESLTRADLNITHAQMQIYKHELEKRLSPVSANRKIYTIRSLYKYLSRNIGEFWNDEKIMLVDAVSIESTKTEVNSYGFITYNEYIAIHNAVKKQYKWFQKQLFLEVALRTSFRLAAMLKLTWGNFTYDSENNWYAINTTDKGHKKRTKAISVELYNELRSIAKTTDKDAKVFTLSENTISSMLRKACEDVGIDHKERNIVFHSIRKLGITMVHELTGGDLSAASSQADHSDVNTTNKIYIDQKKKNGNMPLARFGAEVDMSSITKMSRDELLSLIESSDYMTKVKLLRLAKGK